MARPVKKIYSPTQLQLQACRYCHSIGIAVCIYPIPDRTTYYWIEKHKIDSYKKLTFLRADKSKPDSKSNREEFDEYNAWKTSFEMYESVFLKNNQ